MERQTTAGAWYWIVAAVLLHFTTCHAQSDSTSKTLDSIDWLTGARYRHELEQPFSGSWTSVEYRQLLRDVSVDRRIAILIDRRVDPSVELPIDVTTSTLRTGLISIARQADADVSFPDHFVYFGPRSTTKKLRTLIELRELELQSKEAAIPKPRRVELQAPKTFSSVDLETPKAVLERFSQRSGITISNLDLIPHDLWAGMTLPEVSVTKALSVVLIQFDLTFRWQDRGASIELLPIPDTIFVERKHRPKQKPVEAMTLIQEQLPRVDAQLVKSDIVVKGTIEDQEAVASLLRGERVAGPARIELPKPLKEQQFSLEAAGVPISALMSKLEESAIRFEYDPDKFQAAGIDLQKKIQIKIKKASAEEFFKLLFDPIDVAFQIDHLTVKLTPKNPR